MCGDVNWPAATGASPSHQFPKSWLCETTLNGRETPGWRPIGASSGLLRNHKNYGCFSRKQAVSFNDFFLPVRPAVCGITCPVQIYSTVLEAKNLSVVAAAAGICRVP